MQYEIRRTPLAVAILIALNSSIYSPQIIAAPGDAVGNEFRANTTTSSSQHSSSIAMDADGDFVIAWQSYGQDGDGDGIYARRYNANGTPAGGEFVVNTTTTNDQRNPSVAMDADGDFVITWESNAQDGDGSGIYARRYRANGTPAGNEFLVNSTTVSDQEIPGIAMDADGDFVIVWTSLGQDGDGDGIYARRYNADGAPAGGEFAVNTTTANYQSYPSIAMDAGGDFVIAWQSTGQDGSNTGVVARRYTAVGTPAGGEFVVNTYTAFNQAYPDVALDADGDFVVVWESDDQDGSFRGIYAQRYTAAGAPAGDEFRVNTYTAGHQHSPVIAMDADGDFVISWTSFGQEGANYGIYAQRYTAAGVPADDEVLVNTYTADNQVNPAIAMDADGDFVVVWESFVQDDSGYGVYAQRYEGAAETIDLNLVVQDDTDPVTAGNDFVYSLITTNNGDGIALDVNLSEALPSGLSYVTDDAAAAGWDCALAVATLECHKAFMTAAEVSTINVTVTADTAGTVSNTVTATAAQNDVFATDTETTVIEAAASGGSSGSLGVFSLLLALPLWLRRRLMR